MGSRHHKIALKIKSLLDPDCPEQQNGVASESMGEIQGEEEDSDDENFADEVEDEYRMEAESIAEHVVAAEEVIATPLLYLPGQLKKEQKNCKI